jgi:cellulose synthase/poly-beta-1,6-N-acetylglucosamine synthase-like glycosyltransferase
VNFTGCGFVVNQKILEGLNWKWNFHKLVEDVEISMHLQSHGVRMGYCQNAIFYDQQPTTWSAFYTQGHRWAKGSLQLFFDKTSRNNIFHLNNTINRTDWFYRSFPNTIIFIFSIVLNIITSILTQPLFNICILQSIWQIDLATSSIILFTTLVMVALSIISIYRFCKHKKSAWYKNIYYVLLGPVSLMITIILTIPAYFAKPQWKPIPRAHPTKV